MTSTGKGEMFRLHSLQSNLSGYTQLAQLYETVRTNPNETVPIACNKVSWLDSNMSAPLAAIRQILRVNEKRLFRFRSLRTDIAGTLTDIGFYGGGKPRKSMIPLRQFSVGQSRGFASYTQSQLADKGMPSMTKEVSKRVFEGLDEIFQNFEIHSRSELGLFACGQLYPGRQRLVFSLADMGIGIPRVVNRTTGGQMRPSTAIDWAMTGTNTTRRLDVPGGLGLKILREFIKLNQGKLAIVSGSGYWEEEHGQVSRADLPAAFPGTVVTVHVDTSDTKKYELADEIDPEEVF